MLVNERRHNSDGEWVDTEPTRHVLRAFQTLAENIVESLSKGDRVLVHGTVTTDSWTDKQTGDKRTAQRVLADIVGPSLAGATKWVGLEGGDESVGAEGEHASGDPPQAAVFAPALPDEPGTADLADGGQREQHDGLGERHGGEGTDVQLLNGAWAGSSSALDEIRRRGRHAQVH